MKTTIKWGLKLVIRVNDIPYCPEQRQQLFGIFKADSNRFPTIYNVFSYSKLLDQRDFANQEKGESVSVCVWFSLT